MLLLAVAGVVACGSTTAQKTEPEQAGELLERRREVSAPPFPTDGAYAVHVPDDKASEAARHVLGIESLPEPRPSHDLLLVLHNESSVCPMELVSFEVDGDEARLRLGRAFDESAGCTGDAILTLYAIGWPEEEASELTTVTVDEEGATPAGEKHAHLRSAQEFADESDQAPRSHP